VDTYERDYSCTFAQPTSYLRARGGTATRLDHLIIFKIILKVFLVNSTLCVERLSFVAARAEIGDFVEYDLDNEDEDWLSEFNEERMILTPEL
jgi:enhancer of polycomb-like protein